MLVIPYCRMFMDPDDHDVPMQYEEQHQCILEYCREHDLEIDTWYFDRRIQAGKEYWPVLKMILFGVIVNTKIEGVVVAKPELIAPNLQCYYYYKYMLARKNMQLFCVSEDVVGGKTGMGYVYKALLDYAVWEEHRLIPYHPEPEYHKPFFPEYTSERIIPYGYHIWDARVVIHPDEAEGVREIYRLWKQGKTLKQIRTILNREGRKTKRGTRFTAIDVREILNKKRIYLGQRYFQNGLWIEHDHEPIITRDDLKDDNDKKLFETD